MAIFFQVSDKPSGVREARSERITELERKLESLKNEIKANPKEIAKIEEIRKTKEEILSLRRELNRAKRYIEVSGKDLAHGATDLDSIPATNLMRLDRDNKAERRGEFLSKSFLYKRTTDENGNIIEEPSDGKALKSGDVLYIDLGKNTGRKSAYWTIGLGDMLSADIGYVKVNGVVGVRSIINGRVGYYTKPSPDGYMAVFSGNTVTIPTTSEIGEFTQSQSPKLQRNSSQEESDKANDMRIEKLERLPESSNVDLSVNMRESYDFWKSKGFSEEQVCGLLANEYQESKCNPNAEDGPKLSYGIFQWKKERRDIIHSKTGIDIMKSSHKQQLEAAWWEMTEDGYEKKVLPLLKNAKSPAEAAGILCSEYLRPADKSGEPVNRGKIAENIFTQFKYINNPELANLPEGEANKKIIEYALDACRRGDILGAEHCTDWVDKVYKATTGKTVYRNSLFDGVSPSKISKGTGLHGSYASLGELNLIQPGNHIMVDHMENGQFSQGRTHSVIALSRSINGIAEVVSYPNGGKPPVIEKYDFTGEGRAKNGKVLRINAV